MYIRPNLRICTSFADAQQFLDAYDSFGLIHEKPTVGITEVVQGQRNFIVAEAGVGKTLLLEKIDEHLRQNGVRTSLIRLRERGCSSRVDEFLASAPSHQDALLLDGLDEIQGNEFPFLIEKLRKASLQCTGASIYISSRAVFARRYLTTFSEYRFIAISPFDPQQVVQYLVDAGHETSKVRAFLDRIASLSHGMLVVQIPRYLFLLRGFLQTNNIDSLHEVSRNELFEYLIYQKLELEDRISTDKRLITKRLLEKLALTMEVYQTTSVSKDELMTFFDDLRSDLKVVGLAQIDLQTFFDNSLLKDNHDSIEFDNAEFQEYLAAKEITRFVDPRVPSRFL
jgi:hypothetical protein